MNLEGIRRVMELEAEVERLRNELEHARQQAVEAVDEAERRHRRDPVPLRQSVAIFVNDSDFPRFDPNWMIIAGSALPSSGVKSPPMKCRPDHRRQFLRRPEICISVGAPALDDEIPDLDIGFRNVLRRRSGNLRSCFSLVQ